jgi:hypothetical protein
MERDKFLQKQMVEIDFDPSIVSAESDIYNPTQIFTPKNIIEELLINNGEAITNFDKNVLDNASGDGAIILFVFEKRMVHLEKENKKSLVDILRALKTLFSIEYEYETTWKQRVIIYNKIKETVNNWKLDASQLFYQSVRRMLVYNLKFGAWPIKKEENPKVIEFTDYDRSDFIEIKGFPEWHIFPNCNIRTKNN